ncbi:2-amino-4-hydroxy-6-hydroxymethyldihydropteridine pyrophosphokinase [Planctomycetes bacterium MalM25]|nr:2-amino-4-hydroxy-6-hydroxymethyldihydropteridine pyrophosphokinase [Planctomycetes bacterium MalM25]
MTRCLVSLGSNQEDPNAHLDAAEQGLRQLTEPGSYRGSKRITTAPVGGPLGQESYINAAAAFETRLSASELLVELQRLERRQERVRTRRWDARSLDLDLLLYGETVIDTLDLRVPHPRMTFRPFVLVPACEIAADWRHPECDRTLGEFLPILELGRDAISVLQDTDAKVEAIVRAERPGLAVEAGRQAVPPRLTIDASPRRSPLDPCGPRLVLADCPREHWRDEILAALQCVWPQNPA